MRTPILTTSVATLALAVLAALAALAAALSACAGTETEDATDDSASQELAPLARERVPQLDTSTAQALTPAGTADARQWENTYVGSVTKDLYVAVALANEPRRNEAREAIVYFCDGHGAAFLTGEVGSGKTTLEDEELVVELSLVNDTVSGALSVDGEERRPFTAHRASGAAGLYAAQFSFEGVEYLPLWVVLPDGSQQGAACWQCCSGEGCTVCCGESAQAGNKGGEIARHERQVRAARPSLWDRFWDWLRN